MNKKLSPGVDKFVTIFIVFVGVIDLFFQTLGRRMGFGISNSGISFGMFADKLSLFINTLGVFVLFFFFTSYLREKNRRISIYIILIGGIINMSQRLIYGNVWDYISLPFMPFSNNIADILITSGVIAYIIGF